MAGKIGEFHLRAVLHYLGDWVGNVPETLPKIQLLTPISELIEAPGGNHVDTIL